MTSDYKNRKNFDNQDYTNELVKNPLPLPTSANYLSASVSRKEVSQEIITYVKAEFAKIKNKKVQE